MKRLLRRNIWTEVGISLSLLVLFCLFYGKIDGLIHETLPGTVSPAFFPSVVTQVLILMSFLFFVQSCIALRHMLTGKMDEELLLLQKGGEEAGRFMAFVGYVGVLFLYLAGLYYIGFVYSTPVIMFFVAMLLGLRHKFVGIVSYIIFTLAFNAVAFYFMQVILPTGVLFD